MVLYYALCGGLVFGGLGWGCFCEVFGGLDDFVDAVGVGEVCEVAGFGDVFGFVEVL